MRYHSRPNLYRSSREALRFVACSGLILLLSGCQNCRPAVEPSDTPPSAAIATPNLSTEDEVGRLAGSLVAVLRIDDFSARHGELRQWSEAATDTPQLPTSLPTGQGRALIENTLGTEASKFIAWNRGFDFFWWSGDAAQLPNPGSGWSILVPVTDREGFADAIRSLASAPSSAHSSIALRVGNVEGKEFFINDHPRILPTALRRDHHAYIVLSNFASGARHTDLLVESLAIQDFGDTQLYAWPENLGIASRYRATADLLEQQIARGAHDLLPARVGLLRLQADLYRRLGDSKHWPRSIRVAATSEYRDGAFRNMDVTIELKPAQDTSMAALSNALRRQNLEAAPSTQGALVEMSASLQRREVLAFWSAIVSPASQSLLGARGHHAAELLDEHARRLLEHNRGPTTLAFFGGPQSLTAEVFVGWQAMDVERIEESAEAFHRRLILDLWMPFFPAPEPAQPQTTSIQLAGSKVTARAITFLPEASSAELGACWAVHGGEYLAYYGINPCKRLEQVARPATSEAGPAFAIKGDLAAALDSTYVLPMNDLGSLLENIPFAWTGRFEEHGDLSVAWVLTDTAAMGRMVRELPGLAKHWNPMAVLDPAALIARLSLEQAIYQEPAIMSLGPPGMLGLLPPAFYLGLPFSVPPTPAHLLKQVHGLSE